MALQSIETSASSLESAGIPEPGHLVVHLIAAKRSLSSTSQVYRANELVSQSRLQLEQIVITGARNDFLQNALRKQLRTVHDAKQALRKIKANVGVDFKQVLATLDIADISVAKALDQLEDTSIDPRLQPPIVPEASGADDTQKTMTHIQSHGKTLQDFVDLDQIEAMRGYIRTCIDAVNRADGEISETIAILETQSRNVANAMEPRQEVKYIRLSNHMVASTFLSIEERASDMAESLQSLINHYDLCVTAVRNTEGAGEAVAAELDESDRNLERKKDEPQMSDAERAELLKVIQTDAEEVDDVVNEINKLATEVESQVEQIDEHLKAVTVDSSNISSAMQLLGAFSARMSSCVSAGSTFLRIWAEQLENIQEKLPEMKMADHAFRSYLEGYRRMVSELDRRRKFKASIAKLYEEETSKRQDFLEEWGERLPVDFLPLLKNDPRDSRSLPEE